MFESLNTKHNKCAVNQFCNFCMLRSAIYRINLIKGRQSLKPVELECQPFKNVDQPIIEVLEIVLENAYISCPLLSNEIIPQWQCSCCTNTSKLNNMEFVINMDNETKERDSTNLIEIKYNSLKEGHLKNNL